MSATQIKLRDYVETLRHTIPHIHPAGRATVHQWLQEADGAAHNDDAAAVARFALLIASKIEQELQWQRQDAEVGPAIQRPALSVSSRDAP